MLLENIFPLLLNNPVETPVDCCVEVEAPNNELPPLAVSPVEALPSELAPNSKLGSTLPPPLPNIEEPPPPPLKPDRDPADPKTPEDSEAEEECPFWVWGGPEVGFSPKSGAAPEVENRPDDCCGADVAVEPDVEADPKTALAFVGPPKAGAALETFAPKSPTLDDGWSPPGLFS